MTKQIVRVSVAIMATLLGLAVLWQFRVAVIYVLVSVALAATLRPLAVNLSGKHLLERVGWIVIYLLVLFGFGYLLYMVGKVALAELQQLANAISTQETWILPAWLEGSLFKQVLDTRLLPPNRLFQLLTIGQAQSALPAILGFTMSVASTLSGVFVIVVMSLYWMASKTHFERLWLSLLPSTQRKQARDIWQTVEPDLGAYIRSQLAINIISGLILGLGYWVIGSPYPTLLALIEAFVCAIPFVGIVLAAIIPIIFGLITGLQYTPFIVVFTLLLVIALGAWVKPRLFEHKWDNPILTLILLVALSSAFGLVGIIIAPALAAVIQIVWNLAITQRVMPEEAAVQVSDFQERQEKVWATIRAMEEAPPPQVASSMERLSELLEKAKPILYTVEPPVTHERTLPGTPPPDLQAPDIK